MPVEGPADVYTVTALDGEWYQVKHFPNLLTVHACCNVKVQITDADRALAYTFERVNGMTAAMQRAYVAIERRHATSDRRGAA